MIIIKWGAIMSFKRMEGFSGSIPQKFIDNNVEKCPMCGTDNPHWAIDMKMQLKLEGNLYLFKCEQCGCILSATVPDVTGFGRSIVTSMGLIKKFSGKKVGTIYMKVVDVGSAQATNLYLGKEMELDEINNMANGLGE